uniref:Uncharacterized protein n=1 Tax=Arundo donax TaxID=35708 RepID=A0A0A9GIV7_ARUDO
MNSVLEFGALKICLISIIFFYDIMMLHFSNLNQSVFIFFLNHLKHFSPICNKMFWVWLMN